MSHTDRWTTGAALALTRGLEMGGEPRHLRRQLRLGVDLLLDGLLPA